MEEKVNVDREIWQFSKSFDFQCIYTKDDI